MLDVEHLPAYMRHELSELHSQSRKNQALAETLDRKERDILELAEGIHKVTADFHHIEHLFDLLQRYDEDAAAAAAQAKLEAEARARAEAEAELQAIEAKEAEEAERMRMEEEAEDETTQTVDENPTQRQPNSESDRLVLDFQTNLLISMAG